MSVEKMESQTRMNILAIDDEETIVKLYNSLLKNMGHQVIVAKTGAEAIAKINEQHFDLVILDLRLPDMSGIELLKQVKEKIEDAPVVIVTANPTLESSMEAIKSGGVYDYIIKPFESKDLQMVIQRAVEKAELINENKKLWKKLEKANRVLFERVDELEKFAKIAVNYEEKMSELKNKIENLENKMGEPE